jgi:C_GCAxxG_C_C family probable redox protein
VACAFLPILDIDERTLYRITEGFGGGMGGYEGTCGAISGALTVASLLTSGGNPQQVTKVATYEIAKQVFDAFVAQNSSAICKDLRGLESGIELRSCPGCIEDAVKILQQALHID